MDARKLKTAAIGGAIAAIAAAIIATNSGESIPAGSYRGGYYDSAIASFRFAGSAQGITKTKVISWTTSYPNASAIAAGFIVADDTTGISNKANDGTAVRYGWITKTAPTTVQASTSANADYANSTRPHRTEDDKPSWNSNQRLFFMWFSLNGLTAGDKVDSASIMFNVANGWTLSGSATISARIDTVSADYSILNGSSSGYYGSNNDAGRFDCTWDNTSQRLGTPWVPDLDDRDDYHDFGPRADNIYRAATYSVGQCLRVYVMDGLQQLLDNAVADPTILSRGMLVVIYGTGTNSEASKDFFAGNSALVGSVGKGNPVFKAATSSKRGIRPWNGVAKVPIAFTFDDAYNVQVGYYRALMDSSAMFHAAICSSNLYVRDWQDSVLVADGTSGMDFLMHSADHSSLGPLTGRALDRQLTRRWVNDFFTAAVDTAALIDFAWPGGAGTPVRSTTAIERMVDFGYRAARSGGLPGEVNTVAGRDVWLSWSSYANKYLIWSVRGVYLFGDAAGTAEGTSAQIADNLGDYIDTAYTDYGKAPLIIYAHWYNPGSTPDWISEANLRYFVGLTRQLKSCAIVPYKDIVAMRLSGASAVTPATVAAATITTVDGAEIKAMAARQDSLVQLGGHGNLLQTWIGPK